MRMYDLIMKKRNGGVLTDLEIEEMITGYVKGDVADYQMSAMLMAIWFNGMTDHETTQLTLVMARSGDMIDLSAIEGKKVDKHSTGGVGDKTTLIVGPIVAACGSRVAKMSGRGLGHTGGTVDKLESIPGFRTVLDRKEFFDTVNKCGISLIGQSGNLAPADKKLYALRDVTATVDSIPLIASSIMSKKLAAGSDCILLDVKTGSGAFMKTLEDSIKLAQTMATIGEGAGRRTVALITDMDTPLGNAIGNSLEVMESMDVLKGKGSADLTEVSLQLAANMLCLVGKGTPEECRRMAEKSIENGSAFETFCAMVRAQGGDDSVLRDYGRFPRAPFQKDILAEQDGYIVK
ncbi:MAG: thymidine phosphorylase, partial [Selenomonadaceae bacterium]|nr:thymidine phosphorylase [Selenomonadaceae bacterium]